MAMPDCFHKDASNSHQAKQTDHNVADSKYGELDWPVRGLECRQKAKQTEDSGGQQSQNHNAPEKKCHFASPTGAILFRRFERTSRRSSRSLQQLPKAATRSVQVTVTSLRRSRGDFVGRRRSRLAIRVGFVQCLQIGLCGGFDDVRADAFAQIVAAQHVDRHTNFAQRVFAF